MPFAETRDRNAIAARLGHDPRTHAYELGDLDDFDWPFTRWFGWYAEGALEEVVLLYTQPTVPVVLAIADDPDGPMALLLEAIRDELPARIYVHVTPPLLDVLVVRYAVEEAHPHLKLALAHTDRLGEYAAPADALGSDDLDEITALYDQAYPGTWFEPRLLATGRYVGIRLDGRLACVAGVHVYSPAWSVAALGNVATLPGLRGRGLARSACAALCRVLLEDGITTIALNVGADNHAAIRAYTRLGFEQVAEYTEAALVARG